MPDSAAVIVVEDDAHYRETLMKYLRKMGFHVQGASNAMEFYHEAAKRPYALAIVDLGLPDQSGVVIARYLRQNTSSRVIILSASASLDDRVEGYDAGADLYMVKPVAFKEISSAISSLLARYGEFSVSIERGASPLVGDSWQLFRGEWLLLAPSGEQVQLSAKEYQFLECLAREPKSIISRDEIRSCLGYENNITGNKAMEAVIYRLRKKMPVTYNDPIRTASTMGYSFAYPLEIT